MHRLCGEGEGSREDSLARHHLRLEDHHRVALERRLRHGLGRRRLDDLRLAGLQGVEPRRVGLEEVLELDALVLRQDILRNLVLVLGLLRLLALGLLGLRRDLRLRLGDGRRVLARRRPRRFSDPP